MGQVYKKSKAEERDEMIALTKEATIEKYQKKLNTKKQTNTAGMSGTGQNFKDKGGFELDEKVTKESEGNKLLKEGYMQAFIDFFYLTSNTTPSQLHPVQNTGDPDALNSNNPQLKKRLFDQT